jgi:hypothetical protein
MVLELLVARTVTSNTATVNMFIDDISVQCNCPAGTDMAPLPTEGSASHEVRSGSFGFGNEEDLISPNPTTGLFQLQTTDLLPGEVIDVYNAKGELVRSERVAEGSSMSIDLSAQPTGIYLLKYADGIRVRTARIVKE